MSYTPIPGPLPVSQAGQWSFAFGGALPAFASPPTVLTPMPPTLFSGQVSVGSGAQALPSEPLQNGVTIQAQPGNSGTVYVGGAGITAANGFPLAPGQSIGVAVANLSDIHIIGTVATDGVAVLGN